MKYNNLFLSTTDTVSGIGAPMNDENLDLLFEIKKRPRNKNIIILVSSIEMARKLKDWSPEAESIAIETWPGSVSIVLSDDQAVRMPNQKGLLELIESIGPIYMTSANISGEENLSYEQAKEKFPMLGNYYYFGEPNGKPSTIIRAMDGEVLR